MGAPSQEMAPCEGYPWPRELSSAWGAPETVAPKGEGWRERPMFTKGTEPAALPELVAAPSDTEKVVDFEWAPSVRHAP